MQPEGIAPDGVRRLRRGAHLARVERSGERRRRVTRPHERRAARLPLLRDRSRRRLRQPAAAQCARSQSRLDERDRRFVTELVYGTTRMRRACDALVDRFVVERAAAGSCARCCGSAPTSCASPAWPPTPPSARPSSWRPKRRAGLRQRRAAPCGDDADGVADDAVRLSYPGLDRRRVSSPSSAMRRSAALSRDERAADR